MITVSTPNASHPKAQVQNLDLEAGSIDFRWLNANNQPVDSGGSLARFTPSTSLPTTSEIAAAIEASTS